ncbi:MAG: hypothetical protein PHG24_01330 [Candidatus Pacebacteria bacterium]|nr:hypothetical protein [Candidatus Paceibacterota bacterium]
MDDAEIAEKLFLYRAKRDGFNISVALVRELGSISGETGIPLEELRKYMEVFLHKLVDEIFKKKETK